MARRSTPADPPTLLSLVDDPVYRAYVKKVPYIPETLRHGRPWSLYVLTTAGRWKRGRFATYREAWPVAIRALRDREGVKDVAIVSLRWPFLPPDNFYWDEAFFAWCYRCRRPTRFDWCTSHHALRDVLLLTEDDPYRCYFCGVRRAYEPMGIAS